MSIMYVTALIIWLAPQVSKLNQILHCEQLPQHGLPTRVACCIPQENSAI